MVAGATERGQRGTRGVEFCNVIESLYCCHPITITSRWVGVGDKIREEDISPKPWRPPRMERCGKERDESEVEMGVLVVRVEGGGERRGRVSLQ